MYRHVLTALAAVLLASSPVRAQSADHPAPPPLTAYGALPGLEMMTLSPSGKRLAFITVIGEQRALSLIDLSGPSPASLGGAAVGETKVRDLEWVGEERVLAMTSTTQAIPVLGIPKSEFFIGQLFQPGNRRVTPILNSTPGVFPYPSSDPEIVQTGDGMRILVRAYSFDSSEVLNLYSVDPATGHARLHETLSGDVSDYVLDASGRTVARAEFDIRTRTWSLSLRNGDTWVPNWSTPAPLDQPSLQGLGLGDDSIVVSASRPDLLNGDANFHYFDVRLSTGAWRRLRFEFEPDQLVHHPVTRRLIGASALQDDGLRRYVFFNDAAALLHAQAQRVFAGRTVGIVSWSDDLKTAVVRTEGSADPGSYYLLDSAGGSRGLGKAYSGIAPAQVGAVRPVSYAAADGLEIHGFLTLPPGVTDPKALPLVVLPHGGPAAHDSLGFDWLAQAVASRGYAVLQPNFRGSTGYGQAFEEAGYGEWGRKMQTDLSDGVRWLADQGIADPKRVCILGGSYGGYAALAGVTLDPGVYRCAVSIAGVSDLRAMVEETARQGARRDNTGDRYWNRFMGGDGPGDRSLDARSPARIADHATAPILLLHGRDDTVVPIQQSRTMATALRRAGKPVEFIEFDGEDHWLSRAETRTRILTEAVRFLEAFNPPD